MEALSEQLSNITDRVINTQTEYGNRLQNLENQDIFSPVTVTTTPISTETSTVTASTKSVTSVAATSAIASTCASPTNLGPGAIDLPYYLPEDIQGEFFSIRESLLHKVKLPSDHKLQDSGSRKGISAKELSAYNIISRCAKHVETNFRILFTVNSETITTSELQELYISNFSLLRYLQEEYTSLLVSGTFDENTAKSFRLLQRNESSFKADTIDKLEKTIIIASARSNQQQTQQYPTRYPFQQRYPRQQGYYTPQLFNQRFQYRQLSQDYFHAAQRQIPAQRFYRPDYNYSPQVTPTTTV